MKGRTTLGRRGLLLGLSALGCAKSEDLIVKSGAGKSLGPEAIDSDPIALFSSNPVAVMTLDARALLSSRFGTRLAGLARARSPLPASADFDPGRDLDRVHLAFYSVQGADVAGIALGRFNPHAIEAAAEGATTTRGMPITKTTYAGRSLYTANDIGFSALTEHTLLIGNQTGMRRTLDRIEDGRVRKSLAPWMLKIFESPSAPLAGGADLVAQPLSDAARAKLPFLDRLRTLSFVGNFADPGLHLAGTLTYDEPEAAARGAENVRALQGRLAGITPLLALLGIPQPIKTLDARAKERQAEFVMGVDADAISALLDKAQAYLDALGPAPAPAGP